MPLKTIPFWKMSGAGNDFVVIDNRKHRFPTAVAKWAKRLCHRQEGVGADGLLLLETSRNGADFRMVYYNADGSRASMCGNGARCIAAFAEAHGVVKSTFQFDTDAGRITGHIQKNVIEVGLGNPKEYRPAVTLTVQGQVFPFSSLNTGVPHGVCFVKDVDKIDVAGLGRVLRFHRAWGPAGANINFVQRMNAHTLKVRTYERGVEGETLACGTGVTASAIVAALRDIVQPPVRCIVRGGDTLEVRFQLRDDRKNPATDVSLRGPARLVFKGEIHV